MPPLPEQGPRPSPARGSAAEGAFIDPATIATADLRNYCRGRADAVATLRGSGGRRWRTAQGVDVEQFSTESAVLLLSGTPLLVLIEVVHALMTRRSTPARSWKKWWMRSTR